MYPGVSGRSSGNRRCQTDDNGVFANQYHENNTCIVSDGKFYSFSNCNVDKNLNTTVYVTSHNTLLTDSGTSFDLPCPSQVSFAVWQQHAQDQFSSTGQTPSIAEIIALSSAVVGQ